MILSITTALIGLIVLLGICFSWEPESVVFPCLVIAVLGYAVLGVLASTKTTRTDVNITFVCSKELGECRVRESKNGKTYTLTDALSVNSLMDRSGGCQDFSMAVLAESLNSYGFTITSEIEIVPNN